MMKKFVTIFLILSAIKPALASDYNYSTVANDFGFIQNNVDDEYFITPVRVVDPRFSGSNKVVKYPPPAPQYSLGYMGDNRMYSPTGREGYNFDIWLDNAAALGVKRPYAGNRCLGGGGGQCSAIPGQILPEYTDDLGVYKMFVQSVAAEAAYMRPLFSENMYEFARSWAINETKPLNYKFCSVRNIPQYAYDPSKGGRCMDIKPNNITDAEKKTGSVTMNMTKVTHLTLNSTNALQELFVDSNGNVTLGSGSKLCSEYIAAGRNGISCRMIDYNLNGSLQDFNGLYISLVIDSKKISLNPASAEVYIGNGTQNGWAYWNAGATYARNIFQPGNNQGVYILFTQAYLKRLVNAGIDLSDTQNAFTFAFRNAVAPQSGFYQFTPSNTILIRPRDYGIGIVSKDLVANPKASGKIGDTKPINLDYLVTVSGPRNADEVTAQVTSSTNSYQQNGKNYCVFTSKDNQLKVPFSSYLSYKNKQGQIVKKRSGCNDTAPIYLQRTGAPVTENAAWQQVPWNNAPTEGSFYYTDLSLSFPMDESISTSTTDTKEDWIGTVNGQGNVVVKALWRNP